MTRQSLEPNKVVWHLVYGFGRFLKYNDPETALVTFDNKSFIAVRRKELTEVID